MSEAEFKDLGLTVGAAKKLHLALASEGTAAEPSQAAKPAAAGGKPAAAKAAAKPVAADGKPAVNAFGVACTVATCGLATPTDPWTAAGS